MSVSTPLPPTGRDFLAYQRLVVDAASTRQVAAELNISQTRVRQLIRRVLDWMQQTLPEDTEMSQAGQLRVARYIAADRLERYLIQANGLWEQTSETKYANLLFKVINALSKLSEGGLKFDRHRAEIALRKANIEKELQRAEPGGITPETRRRIEHELNLM